MAERYVSKFGLADLILIGGFAVGADILNILTLFFLSPLINGAMFIVLKLTFWLMGVKNSAGMLVGFISPTAFVVATYMVERAKEQSPALAKADSVVSSATGPKAGLK